VALPKANRLKHRQEFNALFRKGIRCTTIHLTMRAKKQSVNPMSGKQPSSGLVFPNPTSPPERRENTRIGISVSQKVSKKAVVRNRIKRQLKAAFRQLLPRIANGWLLVVVVKPEAIECDYQQFLQELEQLLVEAEVLNGHS